MRRVSLLFAVLVASGLAQAAPIKLYDASLGTLPQAQPWLSHYSLPGPSTVFHDGTATVLDTTANLGLYAGFSTYSLSLFPLTYALKNPALPAFDRHAGYRIGVHAQLQSESHSLNNVRAGFSLVAIGDDAMGLEVAFWQNRIWVQDGPAFNVRGEGFDFDTTAMHQYDLLVCGNAYALHVDGVERLTGSLRDYSAFGVPYSLSNFLFLGDNTGSAKARVRLGDVVLENGTCPTVPEPGTLVLLAGGLAAVIRRRRR